MTNDCIHQWDDSLSLDVALPIYRRTCWRCGEVQEQWDGAPTLLERQWRTIRPGRPAPEVPGA